MKTITIVGIVLVVVSGIFIAFLPVPMLGEPGTNILKFLAPNWTPSSFLDVILLGLSSLLQIVCGGLLFAFGLVLWFGLLQGSGSSQQGDITIGLFMVPAMTLFGGAAAAGGIAAALRTLYFTVFLATTSQVPLTNPGFGTIHSINESIPGWSVNGDSARIVDLDKDSCLYLAGHPVVSLQQFFTVGSGNWGRLYYRVRSEDSSTVGLSVILSFHKEGQIFDSLSKESLFRVEPNEWKKIGEEFELPPGTDAASIAFRVDSKRKFWIDEIRILI